MDDPSISELADEEIIVVTQARQVRSQKKPIQDVVTWMEAFLTFVTIRNRKHPTFTNDLLAYGVRGARDYKGPGWLPYDFQYQRLAAAHQSHGDWGKKDVALWNDTVCKPQDSPSYLAGPWMKEKQASVAHPQSTGGNKRHRTFGREKQWKNSVCFPYSYSGKCTRTDAIFSTFAMTVVGHMPRLPARRASLTPSRDPLGCDSPKRNAQKKKKIKIKN